MRILFMGTPDFALKSLEAIYDEGYNIIGVVTNVDKPKGRGMQLIPTPVKEFALEKNIKVYQPAKVRNNPEFLGEIKNLQPDLICVVAYGKILPQELLDIPKLGCVNVHGSLLPEYRGAAPIQWAVLNGDRKTGVTTMFMNAGMDTGDIILKQETTIGEDETTGELWERLSKMGANLLVETVKQIEQGTATRTPQPEEGTMAPMLSKEMAKIDWKNKNAREIKNLVRGLNPIMGAYSYINGKKIKLWKVQTISEKELLGKFPDINYSNSIENGTVLLSDVKKGFYIKTTDGIISVLEIQGENAKKMPIQNFLMGNEIKAGSIFE